jgi:hypothetical protein
MALDKLQSFKIDPRDAKKLERIATARGTSVGAVIRDAIQDAIYGPAWAMEVLQEIKEKAESEYRSRFAILETAKAQVEEKIKTLTKDAENLTEKMAELLQKEAATDDPNEALEVRKQYKEVRDLLDITNERLESAREKRSEILRGIAQLEKEKTQALNEALRQAFPRVCEPLLDALANRLADVAHALDPFLHAYAAAGGAEEKVLERFLWHRLGELVRERNAEAVNLLGRPTPLLRSNYQSWNAFWQHWEAQTGCKLPIEESQTDGAEEEVRETQVSIEI